MSDAGDTLPGLLRRVAAAEPDRVAIAVDGGERLTYGEWERRSDAFGRRLARRVDPGDRVALRFDAARWTDYAVAYVGVLKAAAVAVPLSAALTDIEIRRILRDCEASTLVAPPELAPAETPASVIDPGPGGPEDQALDPLRIPSVPASALAEILYASGPLSRPSPAPRSHADLVARPSLRVDPGTSGLLHAFQIGTLAGQDALALSLAPVLLRSLVLPALDCDHLCALLAAGPISACGLHPSGAQALLDSGATERHDVSRVRCLALAPGRVTPALLLGLGAAFPGASLRLADAPGRASAVACLRRPRDAAPPAGEPRDEAPPPASVAFSQEGMLWHELFAPGCQNLPGLARRYRGALDLDALRRALDEIVRRHAALRTGFELRDGRAVQVVRPHRDLALAVRDLTGLAPSEQDAVVERVVVEAGRRPFDLVADPLFEPTVLRLADDDHVLVIRTHHTVFDDWSVGVFRRELAKLYAAYAAGEPSPLVEPPLQFADFSRRQRSTLAGPAGTRQLSFWRRELAGAPLVTQLPVDDPDAPEGSPQAAGGPVSLALAPELGDQLRALARSERATVFMTVLAAFGVLVHRYTGQDDLVLATVVANRNRTELEGLIGCFTKKLPLRLRLDGELTFSEALARTRTALLGALSHQDLAFEAVVQDVLGKDAAPHGLVPHVALMFQGVTPTQELVLGDLETAGLQTASRSRRAHFMGAGEAPPGDVPPLPWGAGLYAGTFVIVSLDDSPAGLSCVARGAFHEPAVRQMMESFHTLLADVAAGPGRPVSELALLDRRAASQVLERGLRSAEPPRDETLLGAFFAQVSRAPQAMALRSRDRTLTYADLDGSSDRLAERLRDLDVGPGCRVGIALEPSPELIVAAVAVWRAGAAWVALDQADAGERIGWIVRDASLDVVVGDPGHRALAEQVRVVPPADADAEAGQAAAAEAASGVPVVPAEANAGEGRRGERSPPALRPDDPAVVFYGSGTSAVERGVVLDHRSLSNLLAGLRHDVHRWPGGTAQERRVCLCPPATDDAFLRELAALLDGHALHIPERRVHADPRLAVGLLAAGEVDLVDCAADELGALLEAGLQDSLRRRSARSVEPVLVVGTRQGVAPELWRTLRSMSAIRAHVVYGPPECAFGATVRAAVGGPAPRGVGRPMAGVRSCVLDYRGRPVPPRAVGELHLGGASLARGHLDTPAATAGGRFVERQLDGGSVRLYRTGQLARSLSDGGVELLGPVDGGCDLRGFRVEPARIRAALTGCPGVRELAVALPDDEHGEPRLVAYVVPDGRPPKLSELRTFLWTRLPGYAWPSALVVVERLPDDGEEPTAHDGNGREAATAEAEARSEPGVLGALWAEAMGVDSVAAEENYWQAFSFVDALTRARDEGLHVPGEDVIRNRTIGALATSLETGRHSPER